MAFSIFDGLVNIRVSFFSSLLAASLASSVLAPALSEGALVGHYELRDDLSNSVVGGLNDLTLFPVDSTGGVTAEGFEWSNATAPGAGLKLELDAPLGAYSIGMVFRISNTSGYRKLLDFDSRGSDAGVYVFDGVVSYYMGWREDSTGTIDENLMASLIMTRGGDGVTHLYLNGTSIYTDEGTGGTAFFALEDELYFFVDDAIGGLGEFSPSGLVSQIRIWDHVLSSSEVATAFDPIPEPGALALLVGSGVALAGWRRFRGNR